MWAIDMLSKLAFYTYTQEKYFEPFQYVAGNGRSLCPNRESQITAFLIVADTEAQPTDTIYGKPEFIQLVGIMESELFKSKRSSRSHSIAVYKSC